MNKQTYNLFIILVLIISILGGCGQDTKDITVNEEETQQGVTENTEASEKKEETEAKLGSRSNPVPFQKTATVDDELYNDEGEAFPIKFDLTVVEVERGDAAYKKLISMNEYNEAAPEGYEWVLAKTKVKFVESETEDLAFHIDGIMNFTMVSENGDIYSGDIIGTTDPDFSFEMYVGSEKEGYISGLVKTGEKAQLRYEEMLGGEVFFNLQ
ncbi:hypothetical protein [Metabacillus halosaccharovorans]|uniref:Lipoprotein n=1 Tax=Metabacillus halosaccharovorans TaxID=930124 RepID=A0ABT3DJL1_9BACI|nr:hypothetical protein [Metabacillus halosaccharovorans]MCV9886701.1 hypothetical protein [Metabacillus halosaccharovorans]